MFSDLKKNIKTTMETNIQLPLHQEQFSLATFPKDAKKNEIARFSHFTQHNHEETCLKN